MRGLLYFVLIGFLLFGSYYLKSTKARGDEYVTIPYLDEPTFPTHISGVSAAGLFSSTNDASNSNSFSSKIESKHLWENILIGEWSYLYVDAGNLSRDTFSGTVAYRENNKYTKTARLRVYDPENNRMCYESEFVANGTWSVSEDLYGWVEEMEEFENEVKYDFKSPVTMSYFVRDPNNLPDWYYGEDAEFENVIKAFNEDYIKLYADRGGKGDFYLCTLSRIR